MQNTFHIVYINLALLYPNFLYDKYACKHNAILKMKAFFHFVLTARNSNNRYKMDIEISYTLCNKILIFITLCRAYLFLRVHENMNIFLKTVLSSTKYSI